MRELGADADVRPLLFTGPIFSDYRFESKFSRTRGCKLEILELRGLRRLWRSGACRFINCVPNRAVETRHCKHKIAFLSIFLGTNSAPYFQTVNPLRTILNAARIFLFL